MIFSFTMKNKQKIGFSSGFTLIELLVVISIIGLLSSVILASVSTARVRARDASRVQTVREIRNALELYFSDYKTYPASMTVEALVAGPLANYLKALSPNFKAPNTTTSYLGSGNTYEILIKTESGGSFAKNNGCLASDYSQYDGNTSKTYCLGNNSGGTVLNAQAPFFTTPPTQGGSPEARYVYWVAANTTGANPCQYMINGDNDVFGGYSGGSYGANGSGNLPPGQWIVGENTISQVSVTVTCSATGFPPAIGTVTVDNTGN